MKHHSFILIVLLSSFSFCETILSLSDVCDAYLKCNEEWEHTQLECEKYPQNKVNKENKQEKLSRSIVKSCGSTVYSDYELYEQQTSLNIIEKSICIRDAVNNNTVKMGIAKVNFCFQFIRSDVIAVDEPLTPESCWIKNKKLENKCSALKQCCDPAGRCEQVSQHSQSGRTVKGLREEILIKIADCKERKKRKEQVKKDIINSGEYLYLTALGVPITNYKANHCKQYLACQKSMVHLRINCGIVMETPKTGIEYAWSVTYNNLPKVLDEKDLKCKRKHAEEYEKLIEKRKKAEIYLDHCIPIANITREVIEKQSPCQPELLTEIPQLGKETKEICLQRIHKQKQQCLLLRDCCVQADVCERNAMYGVLADDFLLAETELKTKMNNCYHNNN